MTTDERITQVLKTNGYTFENIDLGENYVQIRIPFGDSKSSLHMDNLNRLGLAGIWIGKPGDWYIAVVGISASLDREKAPRFTLDPNFLMPVPEGLPTVEELEQYKHDANLHEFIMTSRPLDWYEYLPPIEELD